MTEVSSFHVEKAARALRWCLLEDYAKARAVLVDLPPDVLLKISRAGRALSSAAGSRIWPQTGQFTPPPPDNFAKEEMS